MFIRISSIGMEFWKYKYVLLFTLCFSLFVASPALASDFEDEEVGIVHENENEGIVQENESSGGSGQDPEQEQVENNEEFVQIYNILVLIHNDIMKVIISLYIVTGVIIGFFMVSRFLE